MQNSIFNINLDDVDVLDFYSLPLELRTLYTQKDKYPTRKFLIENNYNPNNVGNILSKKFYLDFINDSTMHTAYINWQSKSLLNQFAFMFGPIDFLVEPIDLYYALQQLGQEGAINLKSPKVNDVYKKVQYLCSVERLVKELPTLQQYATNSQFDLKNPTIAKFFDENFDFNNYAQTNKDNFEFRKGLYILSNIIDELSIDIVCDIPQTIKQRIVELNNYNYGDFANVGIVVKDKIPNMDIFKKPVVNPELKDFLLKDMPANLDKLGQALYVYYKMCHTLTYDDNYYNYGYLKQPTTPHRNALETYNVTPQNNNVICSEFTTIFSVMLKEIGIIPHIHIRTLVNSKNAIDSEFTEEEFPFDGSHVWVEFNVDKYVVRADSTPSIIVGDLAKVKFSGFCEFEDGLKCKNHCDQTLQDFANTQNLVRDILAKQNIQKVEELKQLELEKLTPQDVNLLKNDQALKLYKKLPNNHYPISLDMRVRLMFSMVEHTQLKGLELIQFLQQVHNNIFTKDEYTKTQTGKVKFSVLRDDTQRNNPKTIVLFSYNKAKNDEQKDITYYLLEGGKKPVEFSKEDINSRYKSNNFVELLDGSQPLGIVSTVSKGRV